MPSLGIMGEPRVPPLNPSESIVLFSMTAPKAIPVHIIEQLLRGGFRIHVWPDVHFQDINYWLNKYYFSLNVNTQQFEIFMPLVKFQFIFWVIGIEILYFRLYLNVFNTFKWKYSIHYHIKLKMVNLKLYL